MLFSASSSTLQFCDVAKFKQVTDKVMCGVCDYANFVVLGVSGRLKSTNKKENVIKAYGVKGVWYYVCAFLVIYKILVHLNPMFCNLNLLSMEGTAPGISL